MLSNCIWKTKYLKKLLFLLNFWKISILIFVFQSKIGVELSEGMYHSSYRNAAFQLRQFSPGPGSTLRANPGVQAKVSGGRL